MATAWSQLSEIISEWSEHSTWELLEAGLFKRGLRAAALAGACMGTACADQDGPTVGRPTIDIDGPTVFIDPDDDHGDHDHGFDCDLLPDDGPCAYACDPDEFARQIEVTPGSCVVYRCELDDGTYRPFHVCVPPGRQDESIVRVYRGL